VGVARQLNVLAMLAQSAQRIAIRVDDAHTVSGLWEQPPDARLALALAPGAGAGIEHPFMAEIAAELAKRDVATLRYQFPYMERRTRRPDAPALCHATVRAAVAELASRAAGLPLFAGGKSFGGRMSSQAQAAAPLAGVRGLVFLGFPLHPAREPAQTRGEHLAQVLIPSLFLQGTRDELADLALLEPLIDRLGARATLHRVEAADHSFHVPARAGRNDLAVRCELAETIANWAKGQVR
jgi:predicted alpha/beta-hydrolase family hydrolase